MPAPTALKQAEETPLEIVDASLQAEGNNTQPLILKGFAYCISVG